MVSALLLLVPALLVANASGNLIAGRQTNILASRQTNVTAQKCSSSMCLSATVNGSNIDYVLSSLGKHTLGWMGMGFGQKMAGSPMVIMWANAGKVIISQRTASRQVMPTVDPNPSRVASLADSLSSIAGDTSSFGFTIPSDGNTKPYVIFAYGVDPPGSSAADATILLHYDYSSTQLDLSGSSSTTTGGSSTGGTSTSTGANSSTSNPLMSYERMIIAHGILCVLGFMLFLPAGALLPRLFRTFTSTWFSGHWILQFGLAGPTIIAGIALGVQAVSSAGALHLDDDHKRVGVVICVLYILQLVLGAVIHWVKPKNSRRRPIQNYAHAVVGLFIIGLAIHQVYNGYTEEWPKTTGRGSLPNGVNILFYVWMALIAVLYVGGLALLPKQYKQEKESRAKRLPVPGDVREHQGLQRYSAYRD